MILLAHALAEELAFWQPRDDVVLLETGVGPVDAASAVARALASARYDLVVNAGIAGAFAGAAAVGDAVAVGEELFELSLETGKPLSLPSGKRVTDAARGDAALLERLAKAGFPILRGITVARVTASDATAARLAGLGAQVESMEGFAVMRAAERAGVPVVQVRGISNRVGARDEAGWDFEAGRRGLQRVLRALCAIVDARASARPR